MTKLKKPPKKHSFSYYNERLFSHENVTKNSPFSNKFFRFLRIASFTLVILCIVFLFLKNSSLVYFFTSGYTHLYLLYLFIFFYMQHVFSSMLLYHTISVSFEIKNGYMLSKKDLKKHYKILYLYIKVNYLWIFCAIISYKIFKFLNIPNLRKILPILLAGYSFCVLFGISILLFGLRLIDSLYSKCPFLMNKYVTEKTWLYILVFFSLFLAKKIPFYLVTSSLKFLYGKNSITYNSTLTQYNVLNNYLLVIITLILKALTFDEVMQLIVDALFYSTTALTLLSQANERRKCP